MDWSLFGFRGLGQVLNTHPVFVHFPIALFPTAFLFYLNATIRKRSNWCMGGQVCLVLGCLGALITVGTGYWAQESFPHSEAVHHLMETHETIGFVILGLGTVLLIWSFLQREGAPTAPRSFLVLLAATVLLILQNADLGGRMVFVEGAAVRAVAPVPGSPHRGATEGEGTGHHHGDADQQPHHHAEE